MTSVFVAAIGNRLLLNLMILFFYCSFTLSFALRTTADHFFKITPHVHEISDILYWSSMHWVAIGSD